MDILFAQIQADLRSNDALRQSGSLLQALQQSAAGRDIAVIAKTAVEEIVAAPASAVCKKLAFDLIRSTRLTPDLWETVCGGIRTDLHFPDPDVAAAAVSILAAIPSYRLAKLISDCNKEISDCFDSPSDSLRFSATETLGCVLARDDLVTLCENNVNLLDRVSAWWARVGSNMLDRSDAVSKVAFESVGRLFQEFSSKRMSKLAGDKLVDSENSLAIRSNWVSSMVDFVWRKRRALMARSLILPVENFRTTVFPVVYSVKAVASGGVEVIRKLSKAASSSASSNAAGAEVDSHAEKLVGVSDVVTHLAPFLVSSLEPALIYEVGINMLYLADVPGGKPEWASQSIIAILTLWDRLDFASARESIVRAVVTNLHLLDLHMQVSLFKRLLLMVKNLRAESDRMYALACICRTALCVHLFAKESVRRGQKPLPGTDIASLFEDARVNDDLNSITSKSIFREELVASLVESCFQLSLPLPEQNNTGMESRVIGALAYGTGYGALNWTEPALEVVEVCRPCVKWDCDGRTYAVDCYLKLLVRLCYIYDTRGGVKRVKDGASQDQILNETRLQNLQRELVKDLHEDPVLCSVTVGVSHFERCALWVQVLYYPFYGSSAVRDYEGDYAEEDPQIMRQKRSLRPELGEPVILRCQPYKIPLTELLLPHQISPVEFFRLWPSLPAIVEYTGTYTYEGSGFKATAAQQYGASPFLSGLKSLSSKPFHKVCSHIIRTVAGFEMCYAAKTWHGGFLGMMIFGASEVSRNVDLGDETTTMLCKFVVRASDSSITKEIGSDLQGWLDDLTDGGAEYMPEDEVKVAAAERLRISMERIALLKAAQPRPKTPKSDDEDEEEEYDNNKEKKDGEEDEKPKGPSTLSKLTAEEAEHQALQAAVLQEWHMICKDRTTEVN
ncbi:Protein TPLATE [Glycine max]|nr:Protein TPLATE [Glycine max]